MKTTDWPRTGEVHLHCLTLSLETSELTRYERLFSPDEVARAKQLKSDRAKNRYGAGRGMLRDILSGYLGIEPADVPLATGEHGKPFLEYGAAEDLRFNLSHADELLVLAVASGVDIGIDIERVKADTPIHDMARLAFSRHEQEELLTLPVSGQVEAFYRSWVRKEACLKACGRGFSLPSNSFNVSLSAEAPAMLHVCCNEAFWHVLDIDVPLGYCAAVAVEARSPYHHISIVCQ